ncbi:MAG: M16 family metallopeptidase [Candidatus Woesearchaeota archaeon]
MEPSKFKLKNGLPILLYPTPAKSTSIVIGIRLGSITESHNGISHLLEHVVFEGTKKFPTALSFAKYLEDFGGECNGSTGKTKTLFYVKVRPEHIDVGLEYLYELFAQPLLKKESMEKEKKVVLQEIAVLKEEPRLDQWRIFEQALFVNHAARLPVSGTRKSVLSLTHEQLLEQYSQAYCAQNAFVVVCGSIPLKMREKLSQFETIPSGKPMKTTSVVEPNKKTHKRTKKQLQQSYITMGVKVENISSLDSIALDILEVIYSKGQSGWLFDEFRNKHSLSYDVFAHHNADGDGSYFACNCVVLPKFEEQAIALLKEIFQRKPSKKDVELAKEFLISKYVFDCEDTVYFAQFLCEEGLDGREEYLQKVKAMTVEQVHKCIDKYFTSEMTTSIVF